MTNHLRPDYRINASAVATSDGWMRHSLLLVKDEEIPFSVRRLEEHLAAIHARLVDRLGALMERKTAPGRRDERELRFMLDELIEALHRLDDLAEPS